MAYNSTIKPIKGSCIDCVSIDGDDSEKYLIAGRCQMHYRIYRAHVTSNKKKERERRETKVFSIYEAPSVDLTNDLKLSLDLGEWFKTKTLDLAKRPFCMECGKMIPEQFYRHAIAHIFPKAIFKSVSTHPYNFMYLGAGCGCHDRSHTIQTFCKMNVWPIAVERFRLFEKEIKEKHKYLTLFKEAI